MKDDNREQSEIKTWFDELRACAPAGRSFAETWEAALSQQVRRSSGHRHRRWYSGVAAASLAVLLVVLMSRPFPSPPPSISQWKSPTAFLIHTPGSETLRTVPRVGVDLLHSSGQFTK